MSVGEDIDNEENVKMEYNNLMSSSKYYFSQELCTIFSVGPIVSKYLTSHQGTKTFKK